MTRDAMRRDRIARRKGLPAKHVLAMGNGLKVIRTSAPAIAAKVIRFCARRDRDDEQFVNQTMDPRSAGWTR